MISEGRSDTKSQNKLKIGDIFLPESALGKWEKGIWEQLVDWIETLEAPLCIGIYGGWGSGKTSLFDAGLYLTEKNNLKTGYQLRRLSVSESHNSCVVFSNEFSKLLDEIKSEKSQSNSGVNNFILLIDDIEKNDTKTVYDVLRGIGRYLNSASFASSNAPSVYFFVAANQELLLKRLEPVFNGIEDAEEFLASIIPIEYYMPKASGGDVLSTFWPEADEQDAEDGFPTALLKKFSKNFPTHNLRTARRFITSLNWFAEYAYVKPYKVIRAISNDYDKKILDLVLQFTGCLLAYLRFYQVHVYNELVANIKKIDLAMEFLETLDKVFSRERAGFVPSPDEKDLKEMRDRLEGAGLYEAARALSEGSIIKSYREFREIIVSALLDLWAEYKENRENLKTFYSSKEFYNYKELMAEFFKKALSQ